MFGKGIGCHGLYGNVHNYPPPGWLGNGPNTPLRINIPLKAIVCQFKRNFLGTQGCGFEINTIP